MDSKEIVKYWLKTAEHDFETMVGLFRIKRYSDSLFFGHIVLEKVLKALVVKNINKQAPKIHDLVRLTEKTGLKFLEEQVDFLDMVNEFNIRCRYPEYKLEFYKKCTKKFVEPYLKKIKILYKELCQKAKP